MKSHPCCLSSSLFFFFLDKNFRLLIRIANTVKLSMLAIEHSTAEKTKSAKDCLYFLEQYTRGQPRDLVKGCQHMPNDFIIIIAGAFWQTSRTCLCLYGEGPHMAFDKVCTILQVQVKLKKGDKILLIYAFPDPESTVLSSNEWPEFHRGKNQYSPEDSGSEKSCWQSYCFRFRGCWIGHRLFL